MTSLLFSAKSALSLTLYDDRASFLNDTSAAETALEVKGSGVEIFTLDNLTFTIARPSPETLNLGGFDWTTRLPGIDLGINGVESFNIDLGDPVNSFGFDFVEPEFDPFVNSPVFIDSTFEITFLNSGSLINSFQFTRPNDIATFVGFSSEFIFDRVEIEEIVGAAENEFFGSFYTGVDSNSESVPEPSLIVGYGFFGLGVSLMKKSRVRQFKK
ncbi:MAG: hypothetical protein SWY16_15955 [Cyanobacteriota bacterium]|nr:hypothetical protein [Cyanobacteriota bacterium]